MVKDRLLCRSFEDSRRPANQKPRRLQPFDMGVHMQACKVLQSVNLELQSKTRRTSNTGWFTKMSKQSFGWKILALRWLKPKLAQVWQTTMSKRYSVIYKKPKTQLFHMRAPLPSPTKAECHMASKSAMQKHLQRVRQTNFQTHSEKAWLGPNLG